MRQNETEHKYKKKNEYSKLDRKSVVLVNALT